MNDWDRDNLNFLLKADKATLEDWAQHADSDDWEYAFELFKLANAEIDVRYMELNDEVEDVSVASNLLKKFALH